MSDFYVAGITFCFLVAMFLLGYLTCLLTYRERRWEELMATIQDIQAKVTEQQTIVGSIVTLLSQLAQMLKDAIAANDPAAIQAVADAIDANTKALADAVVANTPTA